jgi:hypothetical protein
MFRHLVDVIAAVFMIAPLVDCILCALRTVVRLQELDHYFLNLLKRPLGLDCNLLQALDVAKEVDCLH